MQGTGTARKFASVGYSSGIIDPCYVPVYWQPLGASWLIAEMQIVVRKVMPRKEDLSL